MLAFLEDSKSRDSWQCGAAAYYAVQGGSNFWGFLHVILKYTHSKESCSLRSR